MNGAMAEPAAKNMMTPKPSKIMIMGSSQNFLRCFRKPHRSFKKSTLIPFN